MPLLPLAQLINKNEDGPFLLEPEDAGTDSCLQYSSLTAVINVEMPVPSKILKFEGVFWESEEFIWMKPLLRKYLGISSCSLLFHLIPRIFFLANSTYYSYSMKELTKLPCFDPYCLQPAQAFPGPQSSQTEVLFQLCLVLQHIL